ncbi:MAG: hypothetical protein JWL69_4440 [Phycisphaerales bacterium]|nr:hypothetical protein [Phycisphaerales bacterium]
MDSSSSSNAGGALFALLTGATAPKPHVVASFQFGDNRVGTRGSHEYMVSAGQPNEARGAAKGHLIWDPSYLSGNAFFSVASVRLDVSSKGAQWAVGTNRFIGCSCKPFDEIEKIQVVATAANGIPDRLVQWDQLEVTFRHADGRSETHVSSCLPRVCTAQPPRRSARSKLVSSHDLQQFAEIVPTGGHVTAVQVRGVVTLKAGDDRNGVPKLRADDLQGKVLVFAKNPRSRNGTAKR